MNAVVPLPVPSREVEPTVDAPVAQCVQQAVRRYLSDLGPCETRNLYELFLHEMERPLLCEVMAWLDGNQSRAAQTLGLSRATLRKKLHHHGLL